MRRVETAHLRGRAQVGPRAEQCRRVGESWSRRREQHALQLGAGLHDRVDRLGGKEPLLRPCARPRVGLHLLALGLPRVEEALEADQDVALGLPRELRRWPALCGWRRGKDGGGWSASTHMLCVWHTHTHTRAAEVLNYRGAEEINPKP
jgi:hypothetical protein